MRVFRGPKVLRDLHLLLTFTSPSAAVKHAWPNARQRCVARSCWQRASGRGVRVQVGKC
jgi:hypothetical protein